jgi:hypothetical protein
VRVIYYFKQTLAHAERSQLQKIASAIEREFGG